MGARDWRTYPLRGSLSNNTMRATRARAHVEVLPPPLIMTVAIISEGAIIVNVVIVTIILIAIIIAMDIMIAVAATVVVAVVHIVSAIAGPAGRICPAPAGPARQCAG